MHFEKGKTMETSRIGEQSLESQFEALRSIDATGSAQRIRQGIWQRVQWQKRQVLSATIGACVSTIGVIHFALQSDPFGFIVLSFTTAILVFEAWHSARKASDLAALKPGLSLLTVWRGELQRQLHHILIAQLLAGLFSAMTIWVVWRHGVLNLKALSFLAVATGLIAFAAYQRLVIRPSLVREL
jgi:hypothetical protein